MDIKNIVKWAGVAIFAYGAGNLGLAQSGIATGVDTAQYTQMVVAMVLGGGVFYLNDKIAALFDKKVAVPVEQHTELLNTIVNHLKNPEAVVKTEEKSPEFTKLEIQDLEAINHLAERLAAAKDAKGLELCKGLQNRVFELHHGILPVEEVKVTKNA